jgi:hypothetical protein
LPTFAIKKVFCHLDQFLLFFGLNPDFREDLFFFRFRLRNFFAISGRFFDRWSGLCDVTDNLKSIFKKIS